MRKPKTITLSDEVISYIKELCKLEHRNFSNMVETVIKRYKKITKELDTISVL